jgi:hypothetical protein
MCYTYTRFPLCCNVMLSIPHTFRSLGILFVATVPLNLGTFHLLDLLLVGADAERTVDDICQVGGVQTGAYRSGIYMTIIVVEHERGMDTRIMNAEAWYHPTEKTWIHAS